MKLILAALFSAVLLGGCTASVHPDYGYHGGGHSHGKFCPPGQAKKGRC